MIIQKVISGKLIQCYDSDQDKLLETSFISDGPSRYQDMNGNVLDSDWLDYHGIVVPYDTARSLFPDSSVLIEILKAVPTDAWAVILGKVKPDAAKTIVRRLKSWRIPYE